MSLVEPIPKSGVKSTQAQRRRQWQKDYEAAQETVEARSGGICEYPACVRIASQYHHKAGRKVPGANDPARIMHLCLTHHNAVHANPADSYERGYLERRT